MQPTLAAMDTRLAAQRWTREQAQAWYAARPWLVGCNFIPSTAINQLEMWQAETFDAATIDRELGWAAALGMNTVRTYLHEVAWQADQAGFLDRIDRFLALAAKHNIRPLLVFFDDCWNDGARPGRQPDPQPGVHNSGWLRSPVAVVADDPARWAPLEQYVKAVLQRFGRDERVLLWDLYNEPGNSARHERSLPLLRQVFAWAREVAPQQPLTAGLWYDNGTLGGAQTAWSDVITFHNYENADNLAGHIMGLRACGRPLICTEWMRRPVSTVRTCLPVFRKAGVGCLNWGLVSGKTQTIFPWGSPRGAPEPAVWFHDLLRPDGTPFDPGEAACYSAPSQQ